MAAQTIPLKDALTVVPEYNGENIPLNVFLEGGDEAKEMITNENEANLVKLIRSKLTGEARKAIYVQGFRTIEEMKDFIKSIYAPAKTVHQLLGEMDNEYQRDYETVISFANRIRDLGRCIIETQRVNTGNIDATFKTSIENNCIECFKRGLKPEVEQRLENAGDMEHIVQNAIKAERLVEARRNLRREDKNNIKPMHPNREFKKGTYISQVINSEETKVGVRTISPQSLVICQYCNRTGHSADKYRNRITGINYARVVCQLCSRDGHSANQCTTSMKCQICEKPGHSARQCRSQAGGMNTCQICSKVGHVANQCYQLKSATDSLNSQIESRLHLNCQICDKVGHTAATCRVKINQNCTYCKNKGHTIEECRKRQYNERMRSGNGQGLPNASASSETPRHQIRSTNFLQTEDQIWELLPLD